MRSIKTVRHTYHLLGLGLLALAVAPGLAQKGGNAGSSGSSAGGGSVGSAGSTGRSPSINNSGTIPNSSSPGVWQNSSPIFLSGRVLFDDGAKPNSDIRMERVCGGVTRLEGHTDSKGQFSFQAGQNGMTDTDASDATTGASGHSYGGYGNSTLGSGTGGRVNGENVLWGCELRAAYPGYRSDLLELGNHRSSDDPNIGTIILHRLGGAPAGTISVASALVPKHAQKEYEKGVQLAEKGKFEEAEKQLTDATAEYPKYAMAWFTLGQVQQREGNVEGARKSYESAIASEAKYVSPYDQLALLSAQGQEWENAAKYSQQAIVLDAAEYPSSLWYNALANYHLKKPEEAQKSLQQLLKLDRAHRYPEAENMYAQLLLNNGNYAEAATHLRAYLAIAPNSKGAAAAKELLTKLDQAKASPEN